MIYLGGGGMLKKMKKKNEKHLIVFEFFWSSYGSLRDLSKKQVFTKCWMRELQVNR
jgi:hypothetical protein